MTELGHRTRQQAQQTLARWRRVLLPLGLVYLALHLWVTYGAAASSGGWAAAATLVTLGFGDLYWAWNWWGEPAIGYLQYAAAVAAAMAFASWLSRPFTTAYLYGLAIDATLSGSDVEAQQKMPLDAEQRARPSGAASDGPRGGAS